MKPGRIGVLSAALASVCCLGPVVLVLLGLGTLGLGAFLGRYHWFFLASAVLILVFAWRIFAKEKRRCDAEHCQMESRKSALTTLLIATLAVAVFAALNVYTYVLSKPVETKAAQMPAGQRTVAIPVDGMVCFTCEVSVESSLRGLDGVQAAKASAKQGSVAVTYDPQRLTVEKLVEAINRTGYRARLP